MKTGQDFREAFPPMDDGFRRAVLHALDETGKERPIVKKKIRVSVVIAAVIVLLAAVAVAVTVGQWGIMDFLKGLSLHEAGQLITQTEGVTVETELAVFSVRETLYDGYGVYLTISVRSRDEDALPIPGGMTANDPVSSLHVESDETIAEDAKARNKNRFISVRVGQQPLPKRDAWWDFGTARYRLEEDGTLTIMLSALRSGAGRGEETITLAMCCGAGEQDLTESDAWMSREDVETVQLPLQLTRSEAAVSQAVSTNADGLEAAGITLKEVRLIQTPLTVYYEVDFQCDDISGKQPYFSVNSDRKLRSDVAQVSVFHMTDSAENRWHMRATLSAMEALPDTVDLRVSVLTEDGSRVSETMVIPLWKQ